jgi:hypothetical protein
MNCGFIIVAQNNASTAYTHCAEMLAKSIKRIMPNQSVSLLTDHVYESDIFDHVIEFPYGDTCLDSEWKLANDWQVYDASPYEYTIKIEADMVIPRNIEYWWDILCEHDLVLCTTIRNYRNQISRSSYYRKIIVDNNLPNIYNAITYFKKSQTAADFFSITKDIFENWESWKELLKCNPKEIATTDTAYSLAASIIGEDRCTLPTFPEMSFIHMKRMINESMHEDWTKEFVFELTNDAYKIGTIAQLYPCHYHLKHFAYTLEQEFNES